MFLLPLSSWVKSWATTTALSTAPLMSCPPWTQNFTRISLRSRSAIKCTWTILSYFSPFVPQCHVFVLHFCFFLALWWWYWWSRADVVLWWGCHGTGKDWRWWENNVKEIYEIHQMKATLFFHSYSLSAMSWYLEGKPCLSQMKTST